MARLTGPDWIDELPWGLLGIRTVPKEDLECSSAEMVYGAPLTVPGDFLPRGQGTDDVAHFLPRLRETVRKLEPRPPVPHGTKPSSVPTALAGSRFVFVRRDSHHPPLTPPYEGPYKVMVHGDKSFVLDYGTRQDSVSIDRLKPAFVDPMTPIEAAKRAPRVFCPLRAHYIIVYCKHITHARRNSHTPTAVAVRWVGAPNHEGVRPNAHFSTLARQWPIGASLK